MKFIKPSEISSKVLTLIEESDQFVLLVSPYVKISKWYKLLKKLSELQKRSIPLEFIIREDASNSNSCNELDTFGFNYTSIPDLHCKLYMNEKEAIISSMNLLLSSEINSIELGYKTESQEEYLELLEFCKRHLGFDPEPSLQNSESQSIQDYERDIQGKILNTINEARSVTISGSSLKIKTRKNQYNCFIWEDNSIRKLRISGILSGIEFEKLNEGIVVLDESELFSLELQEGGNGYYDTIWATSKSSYNSTSVSNIIKKESWEIAQTIMEFVKMVDEFKRSGISYQK